MALAAAIYLVTTPTTEIASSSGGGCRRSCCRSRLTSKEIGRNSKNSNKKHKNWKMIGASNVSSVNYKTIMLASRDAKLQWHSRLSRLLLQCQRRRPSVIHRPGMLVAPVTYHHREPARLLTVAQAPGLPRQTAPLQQAGRQGDGVGVRQ